MSTTEEFLEDIEKAKAEVQKLQQSNLDKVKALATYGKGVDPAALANLKVDTFIESFLDEKSQLVYVRNLEVRLRQLLDEALASARQQQITEGVRQAPKGLIITR